MALVEVSQAEAGKTCPYCRFPLKGGARAERCDGCGTLHHEECWVDGNGCAVHGCPQVGVLRSTAITQVAAPPPPPPSGYPQPAYPQQTYPTGGYPPGYEPQKPRRNLGLPIGIGIGVLFAAVAAGAFILAGGSHKTATPPTTTQPPVTTASGGVTTVVVTTTPVVPHPAPSVPAEERVARQLAAVVRYSQQGREDVRSGQYSDAIANRQVAISRLQAITGGSVRVEEAKNTFLQALQYSLQSDESYASGQSATSSDASATATKKVFVQQFNPIARRWGLATFNYIDI
jgi:hypothetical protein